MIKELITYLNPKSPVSEIFRTLRTNMQFMTSNKEMQTILITSTMPEEGKSWTASNLAITFAQAGQKVILVDADMRKGRQHKLFEVLPKPGLSNYLSGYNEDGVNGDISNYIRETEVENLFIMPAGNVPPNPSELLVKTKTKELLDDLKSYFDLIIIDATPSLLVADALILSRIVDGTLIVTAHKSTKKDDLEQVVKNIKNVGGNIVGIVQNKIPISIKKYNDTYYYAQKGTGTLADNEGVVEREQKKVQKMLEDARIAKELEKLKEEANKKRETEINDVLSEINDYLEKDKND